MYLIKKYVYTGLCGAFLVMLCACGEEIEVGSKEWCDFKKEMREAIGEDNDLWKVDAKDFAKYCLSK